MCSDDDWFRAIEQLECDIHRVTPAKCKLFDQLLQHHQRQVLDVVGTKATGSKSTFTPLLA